MSCLASRCSLRPAVYNAAMSKIETAYKLACERYAELIDEMYP